MNKTLNGKTLNFQTVLLVVTLVFIIIKDVIIPNVNSGKLADQISAQAVAIGKIETSLKPLEGLPVQVSEIRTLIITHMSTDKEKR